MFRLDRLISAATEANNLKFGTVRNSSFVSNLPKTIFRTKIGGDRGPSKKNFEPPIYFFKH